MQGPSRRSTWAVEYRKCFLLHILSHIFLYVLFLWASQVAQWQRIHLPMQETGVRSLGQEDPLKKEMAAHASILAWEIPWTEEPGRLQSMGSQKSWT